MILMMTGRGVEKDKLLALELWKQSYKDGYARAACEIGDWYLCSQEEGPPNEAEAFQWHTKVASYLPFPCLVG
jgi:TPR repeat protein